MKTIRQLAFIDGASDLDADILGLFAAKSQLHDAVTPLEFFENFAELAIWDITSCFIKGVGNEH